MNLLPEIQSMREVIIGLLTKHPHLRDDDSKLIANVWAKEIRNMGKDVLKGNMFDTLWLVANRRLTSSETIRRTRQKIQEEIVELRGASYMKRKITGETVRKNINAA